MTKWPSLIRRFYCTNLVVVPYHDDPLESIVAILRVLEHEGDERLHLQDLSSLLHQHIVVLPHTRKHINILS